MTSVSTAERKDEAPFLIFVPTLMVTNWIIQQRQTWSLGASRGHSGLQVDPGPARQILSLLVLSSWVAAPVT